MNYLPPLAIWHQKMPGYAAAVSVVNARYRFEIFDRETGYRLHMNSFDTLAQAKAHVLDIFAELRKGQ